MICLKNISVDTLHKGDTDNTIIIIIIIINHFYAGYLQLYIWTKLRFLGAIMLQPFCG